MADKPRPTVGEFLTHPCRLSCGAQVPDCSFVNLAPGLKHPEGGPALSGKVDTAVAPLDLESPAVGCVAHWCHIEVDRWTPRVASQDGKDDHERCADPDGSRSKSRPASSEKSKYSPIGKPSPARHLNALTST